MHQTKKGNEWYFGMKAHIGVDAESGLGYPFFGIKISASFCQNHGDQRK
jgi:hypothetical protein